MTREECTKIVRLLAKPHLVTVDDGLLRSWYNAALERCGFDEALQVAEELNRTRKWMPKPADFNELLGIRHRRENPTSQPNATGTKTPEIAKSFLAEMRKTLSR